MKLRMQWRPEYIRRGTDRNFGAALTQITSAALISHNIYCEERYTSADGRYVAFLRSALGQEGEALWLLDIESNFVAPLAENVYGYPTSTLYSDNLYYVQKRDAAGRVLMRVNLSTLDEDEVADLADCPQTRYSVATVSPDDRYFVGKCRVRDNIWGLYRVDLGSGTWEIFHEHPDIHNPHPQFEPSRGEDILVQHNRGDVLDDEDNWISSGETGATLYVINRDGGNLRPLPVGDPHTGHVTGHECWVGDTGQVIMTVFGDNRREILLAAPGDEKAKCLWSGIAFGHISATGDGKYFLTDDMDNSRLYIGSLQTGRMLPICETGATFGSPQYAHPHAYIAPGNRHIVFNSDQTGLSQLWSAEIPDGFLEALDLPPALAD